MATTQIPERPEEISDGAVVLRPWREEDVATQLGRVSYM